MGKRNTAAEYIKSVKALLPPSGEDGRRFLGSIESEVSCYIAENPGADAARLAAEFGEPREVIADFFKSMDNDLLLKRVRQARIARAVVAAVLLAAVVGLTVFFGFCYKTYLESKASYIHSIETEIGPNNNGATESGID